MNREALRPRLLAISPPCVTAVNRAVYRYLAGSLGMDVHLVIPSTNRLSATPFPCESIEHEPIPITLLDAVGGHSRTFRLPGIEHVVASFQPTHILVDGDPATRLVLDVVRIARDRPIRVWVLTCENFVRRYFREGWSRLARGHVKGFLGSLATWSMHIRVRRHVDHVFVISEDGRDALNRMGFAGRVSRIPLGFDPELFHPFPAEAISSVRKELGLHHPTVAYFGRLVPEKGVDVLLKALAMLKDLPWQMLLDRFHAYASPYVEHLRQLINDLALAERIVYFDARHTEMPRFVNAADVIVLPSVGGPGIKEQYGRVIPEAMACGKIVIGSRLGAIPDLIGDAGSLTPPGDVAALADRLRQLLLAQPGSLEPLRQKALRRAHEKLSLVQQARAWQELCEADLRSMKDRLSVQDHEHRDRSLSEVSGG